MINRILIRIKVLQIVYSYYQNGNNDLKVAENELLFSLRKSYDLYHYFLLLIVDVTNLQRRILDARKNKYMPTEAELNPNTRLIDNRFAAQIAENEALRKYVAEQGLSWDNDEDFIKMVLDLILSSEQYGEYLNNENDSYETDKLFRQSLMKGSEFRERINKHMKNWETERIANMDLIIMQVALAEIMTFPTIPINVTLNEYIDTAKYYSTPKSGTFINGILDSVVNELKKEKLLLKD